METKKPKGNTPEYRQWYYHQNKQKAQSHKRGYEKRNKDFIQRVKRMSKCCKCGLSNKPYLLEFHHLDPSKKFKSVTDLQFNAYSMKVIKDEIRKCVMTCRNCHMEFHHLERQNIVRTFKEYLETTISELKTT